MGVRFTIKVLVMVTMLMTMMMMMSVIIVQKIARVSKNLLGIGRVGGMAGARCAHRLLVSMGGAMLDGGGTAKRCAEK